MTVRWVCVALISVAVAVGLVGCTTVEYARSSSRTYPSKSADCELEVLSLRPDRPFVELGTFDIDNEHDGSSIGTTEELLSKVRPRACKEGADAILGMKGGDGYYVQAIALRWTDAR